MTGALPLLDAATGVVLTATGVVAWRARPSSRVGALLVLTAACWFAGSLVGVLAFLHRGPLVQLHVSYPTGRVPRRPRVRSSVWRGSLPSPRGWHHAVVDLVAQRPGGGSALDIYRRSSGNARKAADPRSPRLCSSLPCWRSQRDRLFDLGWDQGIAVTYDAWWCASPAG